MAEEVNGRLQYVTDKAGYTAGGMGPSGELVILDNDRDMVTIADYKKHSFFTYNGVPWEPPQVTSLPHGGKFPLDGGVQVTVTGVGFARSPFTHCSLVHPDPAGRIPTDPRRERSRPAVPERKSSDWESSEWKHPDWKSFRRSKLRARSGGGILGGGAK